MLDSEKFAEIKASGVLPSPNGAALKIIDLCQRSNVSLNEITQAIQADPALTGRILKMANSPVFARPRPAVSMTPDVLMSIGIQALRQVVLAFSLVSANRKGHCSNFDYEEFWSRSVATGVAAQLIGAATRVAPPVEVFTCGLLTKIGRLAFSSIYPEKYSELIARHNNHPESISAETEEAAFGMSHTQIAAAMMADWGIPKLFTDAVLYHETPEHAPLPADSRGIRLVWCLHLAKEIANSCFMKDVERASRLPKLFPLAQRLGITAETLVKLGDQMLLEWKSWNALLEISEHTVSTFSSLQEQEASEPAPGDEGSTEPTRILIVDDDPAIQMLLQRLLTGLGYAVNMASNGRDALRLVLEFQPQILITDWLMPEMDGLQLIQALRQTEMGRSIYAIVLTSQRADENLVDAFDKGADDYLVKPIDPTILKAHLKAGMRVIQVQQGMEKDREDLRRLAADLTIAHRHAQEIALTDPLTELYNRRYAMTRLEQEWAAILRNHHPFSIMVLDIDHFKQINDTYGHEAGDIVLKRFGRILLEHSRTPDVACRIGGEEFLILAPNTPIEGAFNFSERVRTSVANNDFEIAGTKLKLTVSIGVAQKTPTVESFGQLLKRADDALYRAKHAGRNCVVVAKED